MKLANPLHYPLAILVGAIALVIGVRFAKLPNLIVVPVAAAITVGGAMALKAKEPEPLNIDNPALERELRQAQQQAKSLANRANQFRTEAARLLTRPEQMELLAILQEVCNRAGELPAKVNYLARQLQGSDSLLSMQELHHQLAEAEAKRDASTGIAREQLNRLVDSLQHNIQLAQQGQDARQAQVVNLSTQILDSAGVLQQMQNSLRTADLSDTRQTEELRALGNEFKVFQENVDLLISQE